MLNECTARGIAFVPFFHWDRHSCNRTGVGERRDSAGGRTIGPYPAQIALAWTLSVAPNVLLIPGTSSVQHLEENLAVAEIELDDDTASN